MPFLNINIGSAEEPYIFGINTDQISTFQDNGDGTGSVTIHGVQYFPQGKSFADIQEILGATDFLAT